MNKVSLDVHILNCNKHRQLGFTLVEIMVALMILAIALTAITRAIAESNHNFGYLWDKTSAHWVAEDVYQQFQLGVYPIPSTLQPQTGRMELHHQTWHWTINFEKSAIDQAVAATIAVSTSSDAVPLITYHTVLMTSL